MERIKFKSKGDLLSEDVEALVNTVNCKGVMGKGIALAFRKKKEFEGNFDAYLAACERQEVETGRMFIVPAISLLLPNLRFIINFPTKDHWRGKSQLSFIDKGLIDLVEQVKSRDIGSIAMPPLGCGLGGLNWDEVKPLITTAMQPLVEGGVTVIVYEPVGLQTQTLHDDVAENG